jgi:hypothetical protein
VEKPLLTIFFVNKGKKLMLPGKNTKEGLNYWEKHKRRYQLKDGRQPTDPRTNQHHLWMSRAKMHS